MWRNAIIRIDPENTGNQNTHYWLGKMLSQDSELCHQWLLERLVIKDKDEGVYYRVQEIAEKAITALSKEQRIDILHRMNTEGYYIDEIIQQLVSGDLDVFKELLHRKDCTGYHLVPLKDSPGEEWINMALSALESGYTPEDIAREVIPTMYSWSGNISAMWQQWADNCSGLLNHADLRIVQIAKLVTESMETKYKRALEDERKETVYGSF